MSPNMSSHDAEHQDPIAVDDLLALDTPNQSATEAQASMALDNSAASGSSWDSRSQAPSPETRPRLGRSTSDLGTHPARSSTMTGYRSTCPVRLRRAKARVSMRGEILGSVRPRIHRSQSDPNYHRGLSGPHDKKTRKYRVLKNSSKAEQWLTGFYGSPSKKIRTKRISSEAKGLSSFGNEDLHQPGQAGKSDLEDLSTSMTMMTFGVHRPAPNGRVLCLNKDYMKADYSKAVADTGNHTALNSPILQLTKDYVKVDGDEGLARSVAKLTVWGEHAAPSDLSST